MNKFLTDAMHTLTNGVYLIGARDKEKMNFMTAAWLTQVSSSPLMLMISIGKTHYTCNMVSSSRTFSVSVLSASQLDIARKCGSSSGRNFDKMAGLEIDQTSQGDPVIKGAAAYLSCKVFENVDAGDHTVFLGEVIEAELFSTDVLPFRETDY